MADIEWQEVVDGEERYFRSPRAAEVVDGMALMYGLDFRAFMAEHAERASKSYWQLKKEGKEAEIRGAPAPVGPGRAESADRFEAWHLYRLSWLVYAGEMYCIVVIDTCERRLVMEAQDVRQIVRRDVIPPLTLRLWREASQPPAMSFSHQVCVMLLDELERYSIAELLDRHQQAF